MASTPVHIWAESALGTLTVSLYADSSDTAVSAVEFTEATNRKTLYTGTFVDVPAGLYYYVALTAGSAVAASGTVKMTNTTVICKGGEWTIAQLAAAKQSVVGIGGTVSPFEFSLAASPEEDLIITGESSGVVDTPTLDGTVQVTTYTPSTSGTQWLISPTVIVMDDSGVIPYISYESDDEAVATVSADGFVTYVSEGSATITGTSKASEVSPSFVATVDIENVLNVNEAPQDETVYIVDDLDVTKHVLVVYNADSADSITLKDYYLANRPGMATANVLGISGVADSTITTNAGEITAVLDGIYDWMVANEAAKPIRYVVVMRGIPSRHTTLGSICYRLYQVMAEKAYRTGDSYQYGSERYSRVRYQGTTCLPCWIDMGTYAASTAYIDKVKAASVAGGLQADGVTVSGSEVEGDKWYFDEKRSLSYGAQLADDVIGVLAEGIDAGDVTYQDVKTGPAITACADCAYLACWGIYAHGANWPTAVTLSGASSWWIGMSIESYNGIYGHATHGDPMDFFAATAFGGADYSNNPVGYVGHTAEPYLGGVHSSLYPALWARGWNFAEAAWAGRMTQHSLVVGDPLVTR